MPSREGRSLAAPVLAAVVVLGLMLLLSLPTSTARAGDPTLDAAMQAIWQATANAQQTRDVRDAEAAAQRGTATAFAIQQLQASADATRQAASTRQAVNATQQAIDFDATRSAYSTRSVLDAQATVQARDARATSERQQQIAAATQAAVQAEGTRQAILASSTSAAIQAHATETAVAIQSQETRSAVTATAIAIADRAQATRTALAIQSQAQEREAWLRTAGITVLVFAGAVIALLVAVLLGRRIGRQPARQPVRVQVIAESEAAPEEIRTVNPTVDHTAPLPTTRVVFDDSIVRELDQILNLQDDANANPPVAIESDERAG